MYAMRENRMATWTVHEAFSSSSLCSVDPLQRCHEIRAGRKRAVYFFSFGTLIYFTFGTENLLWWNFHSTVKIEICIN